MKCKNCGADLVADSKFCEKCGASVEGEIIVINKCIGCGAELEKDAEFCIKCGMNIKEGKVPEKVCPKCGEKMEIADAFCTKCGYKFKKKKKIVPVLICVGVVILGAITFVLVKQREIEMQRLAEIKEFQNKAEELYTEINEADSNFYLLSEMFATSTDLTGGLLGSSFYTSYAKSLCAQEIKEEQTRYNEIEKLYGEWKKLGCDEKEIIDLENAIEEYVEAYEERYELLVESDFSMSDFDTKNRQSSVKFDEKRFAAEKEILSIE